MTDQPITISRRRVLAGLGAVGVASAGAGLGTSAFFNDTESFEGNRMTAGELDLKVDWQQSYFGAMEEWQYVNAHPDHDGDGEQSLVVDNEVHRYSDDHRNLVEYLTCENLDQNYGVGEQNALVQLDDVKPGDKGEITFSLHLCDNPGYVWMGAKNVSQSGGANPEPEQVAEGDAENHADLGDAIDVRMWYDEDCDNRLNNADIMLTIDVSGSMFYDKYGGVVAEQSIDVDDDTTYPETTKIDLVEKALKEMVGTLVDDGADVRVGVTFFDGSSNDTPHIETVPLTDDLAGLVAPSTVDGFNGGSHVGALDSLRETLADIVDAADTSDPDPYANVSIATGTYLGEGIDEAQAELDAHGRATAEKVTVVLSDGESFAGGDGNPYSSPQDAADDARAALAGNPATDVYSISVDGDDAVLGALAGPAGSAGGDPAYFWALDDATAIPGIFDTLAGMFTSEVTFFEGSLKQALMLLQQDNGIPLDGDRATPYEEHDTEMVDDGVDEARECFAPKVGHCLGFAWELPAAVGNEVQGDSVAFDLTFYTEQCRHNEGIGA